MLPPDTSVVLYFALIAAYGLERLAELVVSTRNARWSLARGGVEHGAGHYPVMVLLHTGLLVACPAEVYLLGAPFSWGLAAPMLALCAAAQALRWWCITTLGPQWNTRVIVVPGLPRVTGGPYRWFPHPNYLAVVVEGAALPLVHGAWRTALAFSMLNAALLSVRLRVEDDALRALSVDRPPDG